MKARHLINQITRMTGYKGELINEERMFIVVINTYIKNLYMCINEKEKFLPNSVVITYV